MAKYTYAPNGTAYHLQGGKHTCPSCGKATLQLYIGAESGEPINDQVGKCDRHYSCGYDYPPKAYYADHPEELPPAKDGSRKMRPYEPQKPLTIIPKEYLLKSIIPAPKNGLCAFIDILLQMFRPSDIKRVIDTYYLGRTEHGAVIFWQIDTQGLIREGKVMQYNTHTGGRDKASWATGDSYWVFTTLQSCGIIPNGTSSTKCIFGEHLLRNADGNTRVYVTESEKNAIFGAIIMPDATWVAVGSSQDIGKVWKIRNILQKCHSVVLIPDADALQNWREQVRRFKLPNAKVSDLCAGHAGGWDLADIIRDKYMQRPQTFIPTVRRMPTATPAQPSKVEATAPRLTRIIITPLLPQSYDYMELWDNIQLPTDFFTERAGTAPF